MEEGDYLCESVMFMDRGLRVAEGNHEELKRRVGEDVVKLYGDLFDLSGI